MRRFSIVIMIVSALALILLAVYVTFSFLGVNRLTSDTTDSSQAMDDYAETQETDGQTTEESSPEPVSGVLLDVDTNAESAYSFRILRQSDIEHNAVNNWIASIAERDAADEEGAYHTLFNNGSEGFDMYLIIPGTGDTIGGLDTSNIKIAEAGTALIIHIDTTGSPAQDSGGANSILHIYVTSPPENATAVSERLIINSRTHPRATSTFTSF